MERVLRKACALSLGRYARKLSAMPAAGALAAEGPHRDAHGSLLPRASPGSLRLSKPPRSQHTPGDLPALDDTLHFGRVFTDHMLTADWSAKHGWGAPSISPVAPFSIHPGAQTLQYGAHCFEGMKCYAGVDGRLRLFRPDLNMARFHRSAQRLALPGFDTAQLLSCIKHLLRVEQRWVPRKPGFALYLRPTVMATTPFLGVGPPTEATLFVLLSPCGPYMPGPPQAVKLFLEEQVVRAAPGGVGDHKVGGNYAPTVAPALAALRQHGATQVLYTYKPDNGPRVVSEGGAMNVFFVLCMPDGMRELVTSPLDGTILPGVTRASILELARKLCAQGVETGLTVSERPLTVDELTTCAAQGNLVEVFCTGTAAVVLPVQCLVRQTGEELRAKPFDAAPGAMLSTRLGDALSAIQYGRVPDHEWQCPIDE